MTRFMVVSHDSDEAQTFYDLIEAPDADAAKQIVADVRDYAEVIDALNEEDVRRFLGCFDVTTVTDARATRAALAAELDSDLEFCRTCDANLADDAGEGYDGECGSCADKTEKQRKGARV